MPRIPQKPECDCNHIPVGASEDIKLKIMEEKLYTTLKAEIPGIENIVWDHREVDPTHENRVKEVYKITFTNGKPAQYINVWDGKDAEGGHDYHAGFGLLLNESTYTFSVNPTEIPTKTEFNALKTEVEGVVMPEVEQLQTDVSTLQTEVNDLDERVEDLREEIEDPESGLAKKIAALEARLDTAEARMTEIEARIAAIKLENIPGTLDGGDVT